MVYKYRIACGLQEVILASSNRRWMDGESSLRSSNRGFSTFGCGRPGAKPFETFDAEGVRYFHLGSRPARRGFGGVVDRWGHGDLASPMLAEALAVVESFEPDLIHVHGSEGPIGLLSQSRGYTRPDFTARPAGRLFAVLPDRHTYCGRLARYHSPSFAKGRGLVHSWWNIRISGPEGAQDSAGRPYFSGRTEWDRTVLSVLNAEALYYHSDRVLRPDFYDREWRNVPDGPFVVYTTGSPAPYKGLVNLLEAVALVRGSVQREIQLRVGGQVLGTSMWPIVRRAAVRLGLENATAWLGPLGPDGIVSELKAASVYVHPSLIDNSPNALAEAMMVGVPCVASSAGGIPSMIADGVDGLLYAPNDVYGLAGRIAAVALKPDLATRLGANARARAQRRHDPRAIARETFDTYADVLARHRLAER